MLNQEILKL